MEPIFGLLLFTYCTIFTNKSFDANVFVFLVFVVLAQTPPPPPRNKIERAGTGESEWCEGGVM